MYFRILIPKLLLFTATGVQFSFIHFPMGCWLWAGSLPNPTISFLLEILVTSLLLLCPCDAESRLEVQQSDHDYFMLFIVCC